MVKAQTKDRLKGIQHECCPKCGQGSVFKTKGSFIRFEMPQMHEHCPVCHHRFESEPGFFTGAMYASYGLTIIEMVIAYLISLFLPLSDTWTMVLVCLPVVLLWVFNFRKSRLIWMYLF